MTIMLPTLYISRHALVNLKDRMVIVVESLLCPTIFRETLAKVLFCHFEVRRLRPRILSEVLLKTFA